MRTGIYAGWTCRQRRLCLPGAGDPVATRGAYRTGFDCILSILEFAPAHPRATRARASSLPYPDRHSPFNLAAGRLHHIAGTAWLNKRHLNIELLRDRQIRDKRCRHRVSQCRVLLSPDRMRKLDTKPAIRAAAIR